MHARLDPVLVARQGSRVVFESVPPQRQPKTAPNYFLIAIIGGNRWQQAHDVTSPENYAALVTLAATVLTGGTYFRIEALYHLHTDFAEACECAGFPAHVVSIETSG